jgi:hypothetical protein
MLRATQHLVQKPLSPATSQQILRRNTVGLVPYTIPAIGGLLTPNLTLVTICATIAISYASPSTTSGEPQALGSGDIEDDLDVDRA